MGNCSKNVTNTLSYKTNNKEEKIEIKTKDLKTLNINNKVIELNLENTFNDVNEFSIFCHYDFPNLEVLNLSHNNLSDISELVNLNSPKLKKLDLSYNKLKNIDVFRKLNFPLEEINLSHNEIDNICIFIEAKILCNAKKLILNDNEFDYDKFKNISVNKENNENIVHESISKINDRKLEEQMNNQILETLKLED